MFSLKVAMLDALSQQVMTPLQMVQEGGIRALE